MPPARRFTPLGVLLLLSAMLLTPSLRAQHGGGGGGGGMSGGGGMPGGGPPSGGSMGNGAFGPNHDRAGGMSPNSSPDSAGSVNTMRGGLQLGPPGRWWDDKHFAKDLKLRPDQQKRMDGIFEANRALLTRRLEDVHQEEGRFEGLVHSRNPDEAALDAEIDRRSQARAELEKAYTHYLLLLRNEMDPGQLSRIEDHR